MSDETQINESSILEERKKKLKLLRNQNKAYINNFVRKDLLSNILKQYQSLSKNDLESKNIDLLFTLDCGAFDSFSIVSKFL